MTAVTNTPWMAEGEPEEIDPDHLPDVLEGLPEAGRGEIATDEEVAPAFRCFTP